MKKNTYETPRLDCLDVAVERGFAASANNWFQDIGGSTQVDTNVVPEEQWG